jgi:EAL domain-containing protein (putative c-di-GMP-specific phosphodiesterase class I)
MTELALERVLLESNLRNAIKNEELEVYFQLKIGARVDKVIGVEVLIMKYSLHVISTLEAIKKLGVSISVDDFGTGCSSLSYIKCLPIEKLKIDRSFVEDLPYDKDDVEIVKTIIALVNNLSSPLKVDKCREFLLQYM